MYFRSNPVRDMSESKADSEEASAALAGMTQDAAAEEGSTASASEANRPAAQPGAASGFSRYLGAATIALIAGIVVFLTVMSRKK